MLCCAELSWVPSHLLLALQAIKAFEEAVGTMQVGGAPTAASLGVGFSKARESHQHTDPICMLATSTCTCTSQPGRSHASGSTLDMPRELQKPLLPCHYWKLLSCCRLLLCGCVCVAVMQASGVWRCLGTTPT